MSIDQWDEGLRGKKMSDAAGKVIFKYQMPVLERFTMRLPRGAEIIRMADQGGMFWIWAVVDTRLPDEDRHFVAVKCGANVPEIPDLTTPMTVEAAAKVLLNWWSAEAVASSDARKIVAVCKALTASEDDYERFLGALRALSGEKPS